MTIKERELQAIALSKGVFLLQADLAYQSSVKTFDRYFIMATKAIEAGSPSEVSDSLGDTYRLVATELTAAGLPNPMLRLNCRFGDIPRPVLGDKFERSP